MNEQHIKQMLREREIQQDINTLKRLFYALALETEQRRAYLEDLQKGGPIHA